MKKLIFVFSFALFFYCCDNSNEKIEDEKKTSKNPIVIIQLKLLKMD
jgi:hypothetical protein